MHRCQHSNRQERAEALYVLLLLLLLLLMMMMLMLTRPM
jgi:hypothetical protein